MQALQNSPQDLHMIIIVTPVTVINGGTHRYGERSVHPLPLGFGFHPNRLPFSFSHLNPFLGSLLVRTWATVFRSPESVKSTETLMPCSHSDANWRLGFAVTVMGLKW